MSVSPTHVGSKRSRTELPEETMAVKALVRLQSAPVIVAQEALAKKPRPAESDTEAVAPRGGAGGPSADPRFSVLNKELKRLVEMGRVSLEDALEAQESAIDDHGSSLASSSGAAGSSSGAKKRLSWAHYTKLHHIFNEPLLLPDGSENPSVVHKYHTPATFTDRLTQTYSYARQAATETTLAQPEKATRFLRAPTDRFPWPKTHTDGAGAAYELDTRPLSKHVRLHELIQITNPSFDPSIASQTPLNPIDVTYDQAHNGINVALAIIADTLDTEDETLGKVCDVLLIENTAYLVVDAIESYCSRTPIESRVLSPGLAKEIGDTFFQNNTKKEMITPEVFSTLISSIPLDKSRPYGSRKETLARLQWQLNYNPQTLPEAYLKALYPEGEKPVSETHEPSFAHSAQLAPRDVKNAPEFSALVEALTATPPTWDPKGEEAKEIHLTRFNTRESEAAHQLLLKLLADPTFRTFINLWKGIK